MTTAAQNPPDLQEVVLVARGLATAVAPDEGITDVQAALLEAIASALTGFEIDYRCLDALSADDFAAAISHRDEAYRQRLVHHMVLGELVLRPLPIAVAARVAKYAQALGIDDKFVRVARRYAQGAYGLAWIDLARSGFTQHLDQADQGAVQKKLGDGARPFAPPDPDPALAGRWAGYRELPEGTLGRAVVEMYDGRGFALPGSPDGASEFLAQHDYVHVLADYGTNLKGELEVFACIGRADPDPKGFAWLATLVGLFETGYIEDTGFFERDIREHNIRAPGMHRRLADAIRRGKEVCDAYGRDLFEVEFESMADQPIDAVRAELKIPPKAPGAVESGSAGLFSRDGMSEIQRRFAEAREKEAGT